MPLDFVAGGNASDKAHSMTMICKPRECPLRQPGKSWPAHLVRAAPAVPLGLAIGAAVAGAAVAIGLVLCAIWVVPHCRKRRSCEACNPAHVTPSMPRGNESSDLRARLMVAARNGQANQVRKNAFKIVDAPRLCCPQSCC